MTDILDKAAEWSERYGNILRASAETQFPHLYKGAVGGMEHVISVDNGGNYLELWRQGDEGYYATTGAFIKPLPGLAKGARLDEALDRFFHLMAKVEKGKEAMKRRLNMHRDRQGSTAHHERGAEAEEPSFGASDWFKHQSADHQSVIEEHPHTDQKGRTASHTHPPVGRIRRKAVPKKIKRLLGLKKRVMAKVDPEIGPSHSVGHRKPSDLSPESGVSKLAKRMIVDLMGEPYNQMNKNGKGSDWYAHSKLNPARPKPVKKNVVALTGNQPGSGRVKPKTKPGTPAKTYQSDQGFGGKRMGDPKKGGAASGAARGGSPFGKALRALKRARKARVFNVQGQPLGQKTSQRRAPPSYGRPKGLQSRKLDGLEGGRVDPQGRITPVKPKTGGPGQPVGYGSTGRPQYDYSRYQKGCGCAAGDAVAKALRAVEAAG